MLQPLLPFRIGDVEIASPVVLAPLAGYTDLAYRRICRRLGAPYVATEMMLDRMLLVPGKLRRRLVRIADDEHPIAAQLIGNQAGDLAAAAEVACEMGFDVIDLNFGCPVNKALRRRRGAWLMREPQRVVELTRAVIARSWRPVTLKVRQRFADADGEDDFWRVAEGARQVGAAGIGVHARSVEAKYLGPADWEFLARVRRRFPDWTVLGSGDVLDAAAALEMLRQTQVNGVLAARGVLGNPWLFRQVRDLAAGREAFRPSLVQQRQVIAGHFEAAVELYGPVKGPKVMRKLGIKYSRLHPLPRKVRIAFAETKSPAQWHAVLERFYGDR